MTTSPSQDRLLDRFAVSATDSLAVLDREELDTLLESDDESMDLAAAAASVALLKDEIEPMPASLRARLDDEANRFGALITVETRMPPRTARPDDAPIPFVAWAGWLAAAAAIVLAVSGWWLYLGLTAGDAPLTNASLADAREALMDRPGTRRADWADWSDPEVEGVRGDVVWNESSQRGYLRLVGLPENDPSEQQYQLWIIDSRGLADDNGQSARISGAIFDAESGETLVPIDPAIPVKDAAAFAVTIEQPGGVWASDMSRRVVIAQLDG